MKAVQHKAKWQMKLTGVSIRILERIYGANSLDERHQMLRDMKRGTVGRAVADLIDAHGYKLIPKFEDHDLKHVVLGYDMTRGDEIRMQAYLLGNGNRTLPCLLFLMNGLLYPPIWKDLIAHYRLGKIGKSIFDLRLDECLHRELKEVKAEYGMR